MHLQQHRIESRVGPVARRGIRPRIVSLAFFAVVLALIGAAAPAAAQDQQLEPAFGDSIISTYGYPEVAIHVAPTGSKRRPPSKPGTTSSP